MTALDVQQVLEQVDTILRSRRKERLALGSNTARAHADWVRASWKACCRVCGEGAPHQT